MTAQYAEYVRRLEREKALLQRVVVQLADALEEQFHNPFGVGQYLVTEAALKAYYDLGGLGVTPSEENAV